MKIFDKFTVEERDLIGESSKIEDRDYSIDEIRYIKSNVIDNIFIICSFNCYRFLLINN